MAHIGQPIAEPFELPRVVPQGPAITEEPGIAVPAPVERPVEAPAHVDEPVQVPA